MWILIISLIALVCIALLAGYIRNQRLQKKIERGELDAMPEVKEADAECCGQHEICERYRREEILKWIYCNTPSFNMPSSAVCWQALFADLSVRIS